ncbi:hypothetical protein B0J17DRAFT_626853 [Rhizoctonia solani]|nr:hypothetical protein B0J17DRAFT_626853 [Rhizoctonia solani]
MSPNSPKTFHFVLLEPYLSPPRLAKLSTHPPRSTPVFLPAYLYHALFARYKEAKDPHIKLNPEEKQDELFSELSRLVVQDRQGDIQTFSVFRFEAEKNFYGKIEFLMYIPCGAGQQNTSCDIQVAKEFRGIGICRRAFTALESITQDFQAVLVMLSCFRCNTHVLAIYEHLGYKEHIDTTDTAKVFWKPIKKELVQAREHRETRPTNVLWKR